MIISHLLFNSVAIFCVGMFGLIGHSNGLSLELYHLLTCLLSGLFALFLGSHLHSYAEFGPNLDTMLPIFVLAIAIPSNTLLKSLIIPRHAINRLDNNKPSFYTFGGIIGAMRGLWLCTLLISSIGVTNNPDLINKFGSSFTYTALAPLAAPLQFLTPHFYKNKHYVADSIALPTSIHMPEQVKSQAENACGNELILLQNELSKAQDIDANKLSIYSKMLLHLDCEGVDLLKRKFAYLQSISNLKGRVVGYLVAKEFSAACAKREYNVDQDQIDLMNEDALLYLQSFTSDNIIYHSSVKTKKEPTQISVTKNSQANIVKIKTETSTSEPEKSN